MKTQDSGATNCLLSHNLNGHMNINRYEYMKKKGDSGATKTIGITGK